MIPESAIYITKQKRRVSPPRSLVQLVRLVRVVKLVSWHISFHSYELHHLNVTFTTYTCGVYWTRENALRYFSSSDRPFCVVSIGRPVKTIAFSSHIISYSSNHNRSSPKWNLQQYKKLARQRVSTSQVDLDQTCYAFTCWKDRS